MHLEAIDWTQVSTDLDAYGAAVIGPLLSTQQCGDLVRLYDSGDENLFRNRVVMSRHGYGRGEYKYFAYPLPEIISELRTKLYEPLSAIANDWNDVLKIDTRYPSTHRPFLDRCHQAGQTRATPLLLQYVAGDFNCLHQDLYGEHAFPLQIAFLLSAPDRDFRGGELVLTEQRPRMQSRAEVVHVNQGQGVIFPVHHRPVQGARGIYRVTMRHGVSRLRSGTRHTLGIIFHDSQSDIPQMDFGWTLLHAADDECIAVGSVDQGFSGSGKHSEPPRHLKSAANAIRGADLPLWNP
jgi:hypothetical protein